MWPRAHGPNTSRQRQSFGPLAAAPMDDTLASWFGTRRRGRGLYTRTTALSLSSKIYVILVVTQAVVLLSVNTALSVITDDCLSTLVLGLGSVSVLFMSYFAIEAVRNDNRYQLAAYLASSAVFPSGYVPPLVGASDGPMRLHMHGAKKQEEVRILLFVALGSMTALQLCAPPTCTHTRTALEGC